MFRLQVTRCVTFFLMMAFLAPNDVPTVYAFSTENDSDAYVVDIRGTYFLLDGGPEEITYIRHFRALSANILTAPTGENVANAVALNKDAYVIPVIGNVPAASALKDGAVSAQVRELHNVLKRSPHHVAATSPKPEGIIIYKDFSRGTLTLYPLAGEKKDVEALVKAYQASDAEAVATSASASSSVFLVVWEPADEQEPIKRILHTGNASLARIEQAVARARLLPFTQQAAPTAATLKAPPKATSSSAPPNRNAAAPSGKPPSAAAASSSTPPKHPARAAVSVKATTATAASSNSARNAPPKQTGPATARDTGRGPRPSLPVRAPAAQNAQAPSATGGAPTAAAASRKSMAPLAAARRSMAPAKPATTGTSASARSAAHQAPNGGGTGSKTAASSGGGARHKEGGAGEEAAKKATVGALNRAAHGGRGGAATTKAAVGGRKEEGKGPTPNGHGVNGKKEEPKVTPTAPTPSAPPAAPAPAATVPPPTVLPPVSDDLLDLDTGYVGGLPVPASPTVIPATPQPPHSSNEDLTAHEPSQPSPNEHKEREPSPTIHYPTLPDEPKEDDVTPPPPTTPGQPSPAPASHPDPEPTDALTPTAPPVEDEQKPADPIIVIPSPTPAPAAPEPPIHEDFTKPFEPQQPDNHGLLDSLEEPPRLKRISMDYDGDETAKAEVAEALANLSPEEQHQAAMQRRMSEQSERNLIESVNQDPFINGFVATVVDEATIDGAKANVLERLLERANSKKSDSPVDKMHSFRTSGYEHGSDEEDAREVKYEETDAAIDDVLSALVTESDRHDSEEGQLHQNLHNHANHHHQNGGEAAEVGAAQGGQHVNGGEGVQKAGGHNGWPEDVVMHAPAVRGAPKTNGEAKFNLAGHVYVDFATVPHVNKKLLIAGEAEAKTYFTAIRSAKYVLPSGGDVPDAVLDAWLDTGVKGTWPATFGSKIYLTRANETVLRWAKRKEEELESSSSPRSVHPVPIVNNVLKTLDDVTKALTIAL